MEKNWYANGLSAHEGQSYSWTQTPSEVTVTLELKPLCGAKELEVKLGATECSVRRRAAPAGEYLLQGTFAKPHRLDDASWYIEDRKTLTIQLTKLKRSEWWMSVFQGHKEISWDQIQPEHPTYVEDLDGDTQALVKKMMFDNQQRQRGLPTSEELEKQKILQQFQSQHPELDLSELIAKASSASPTASSSAQTFNITSESSPSSSQP